jgi:hypothetical protein
VPDGLAKQLAEHRTNSVHGIKDKTSFDRMILEGAKARGLDAEKLAQLEPREAVELAVSIVCDRLSYLLVDTDREFLGRYGAFLPIDRYLQIGQGDCDKYSYAVAHVFDFLKAGNPKLANVYVTANAVGGAADLQAVHAWSSVVVVGTDGITVSHIDPTAYDKSGKLAGERGVHVADSAAGFLGDFYADVGAPAASYLEREKAYRESLAKLEELDQQLAAKRAAKPEAPPERVLKKDDFLGRGNQAYAQLMHTHALRIHAAELHHLEMRRVLVFDAVAQSLVDVARSGLELTDPRILDTVRARHDRLFTGADASQPKYADAVLWHTAAVAARSGDAPRARQLAATLRREHPKSDYLKRPLP